MYSFGKGVVGLKVGVGDGHVTTLTMDPAIDFVDTITTLLLTVVVTGGRVTVGPTTVTVVAGPVIVVTTPAIVVTLTTPGTNE